MSVSTSSIQPAWGPDGVSFVWAPACSHSGVAAPGRTINGSLMELFGDIKYRQDPRKVRATRDEGVRMHSIRDLAKGWRGNTGSRLRRPLTATLLAIALIATMSASALSRAPASA